MTTIRNINRDRFTCIANSALQDHRLSFRARGVLAWILSMPADWQINAAGMMTRGTEGRNAIRLALRELEEYGYLDRSKVCNPSGRWSTVITLRESPVHTDDQKLVVGTTSHDATNPQVAPTTKKPMVGGPTVGEPVVGEPVVGFLVTNRQNTITKDDDDARVRQLPPRAVPSSSSINHSDGIHSLVDQAVRRLAVIEHRQYRTGWAAGVKRNWRAERDAEGWTRYDKAAVWLAAGIERASVVEKVIRDDLLTGPPEQELAPSTLFDEPFVGPPDPAYLEMPASLERVDELLAAAGLGDRYRSRKNPNPPL